MDTQKKTTLLMRQLLLLIALLAAALPTSAKDGDYFSADGFRFKILSETQKTVAVCYDYGTEYIGDITIPGTIIYENDTYTVTWIGSQAFAYCSAITSVTIPNSVTTIGHGAFSNCYALAYVNIPISVTDIWSQAFCNCASLTSIEIPNSVLEIGDSAFSNCIALVSIDIPDSVKIINTGAFDGCIALSSVNIGSSVDEEALSNSRLLFCSSSVANFHVSENNPHFCSANEAIYSKDKTKLYRLAPKQEGGHFNIPNSVTTIGNSAFRNCTALTSVTIPNSVTTIEHDAFWGCDMLVSVDIPESVIEIGSSAFYGCSSLTEITIPNSVTNVSWHAFGNCTALAYINIPNSVVEIGSGAFYFCKSLVSVAIGNSVKTINPSAFASCTSLTQIEFPESVSEIRDGAFWGCDALTSMKIGKNVEVLGDNIFASCKSLTKIEVSKDNPNYSSDNNSLFNKDKTELLCYPAGNTGKFDIPNTVQKIGNYSFAGCTGLTSASIPNSVKNVGTGAFLDCSTLTEITIPNSVTIIGDFPFSGCTALTTMTLGMAKISNKFTPKLKTLTLTESVESLKDSRFDIEDAIYCLSENPPKCYPLYEVYNSFNYNTSKNATLYVPAGCSSKYKKAEGWKEFQNIKEMDSGVEDVVSEETAIRVVDGCIVIDGTAADAAVEVYDMTGKAVYRGAAAEIPSMPRGIYIVRIGGKSVKVAV